MKSQQQLADRSDISLPSLSVRGADSTERCRPSPFRAYLSIYQPVTAPNGAGRVEEIATVRRSGAHSAAEFSPGLALHQDSYLDIRYYLGREARSVH